MKYTLGAITVLLAMSIAPRASAWCRMTTSRMTPTADMPCVTDGVPLSWTRRCMSYAFYQGGSSDLPIDEVERIFNASFASWLSVRCDGESPGFDVRQLEERSVCDLAEHDREGPNVNNVIFLSGAEWAVRDHDSRAFALTTVWHDKRTGVVVGVDMEINEERGPYVVCPEITGCRNEGVDLQNVVTHEIGHFFTLAHSDQPTATMFPDSRPGEVSKRILRDDDTTGLCSIYPPGSLPTECEYEPDGGLSLVCKPPPDDCDCAVPGPSDRSTAPLFGALSALGIAIALRRRR